VWARSVLAYAPTPHAGYSLIRAMLESLATSIWILGPGDSVVRVSRAFRLAALELHEFRRFIHRAENLSQGTNPEHLNALHQEYDVAIALLRSRVASARIEPETILRKMPLSRTEIVEQAAEHVPGMASIEIWQLWSICSGLAHGQPLYSSKMSDRTEFVFHDASVVSGARASGIELSRFIDASWWMLETAIDLYNERASERS
jgi:hypothetical protein